MTDSSAALPPEAYGAVLASLPGMGPRRLRGLLVGRSPEAVWQELYAGEVGPTASDPAGSSGRVDGCDFRWAEALSKVDVADTWRRLSAAGVQVEVLGRPGYPAPLAEDHQAPAVLFSRGRMTALHHRRVAIVGTRRCTNYGRDVARELGHELAAAGVVVVSGLALGIDGAAHRGALAASAAPPVGVVGSGLDVVYPGANATLWHQVADQGLLCSEAPLGAAPEAWRFPLRNRILAALSEVMVVVESHTRGGSRHSVEAAEARGRTVMAVPGSVRSAASDYTNSLLAEGCAPVRDVTDVLVALGLSSATRTPATDRRAAPDSADLCVLNALGWEPATFEQMVLRTGLPPGAMGLALARLERDGWVVSSSAWWERAPAP